MPSFKYIKKSYEKKFNIKIFLNSKMRLHRCYVRGKLQAGHHSAKNNRYLRFILQKTCKGLLLQCRCVDLMDALETMVPYCRIKSKRTKFKTRNGRKILVKIYKSDVIKKLAQSIKVAFYAKEERIEFLNAHIRRVLLKRVFYFQNAFL